MPRKPFRIQTHGLAHLRRCLADEKSVIQWGLYDNKSMVFPSLGAEQQKALIRILDRHARHAPDEYAETGRRHLAGSHAFNGPTHYRFHPDMDLPAIAPFNLYESLGLAPRRAGAMSMGQSISHSFQEGAAHFFKVVSAIQKAGIEAKIMVLKKDGNEGTVHVWHINPPKKKTKSYRQA